MIGRNNLYMAAAFAATVLIGCGDQPPKPADATQAHVALKTALDAWQRGEKPGALSDADPRIQVSDHQWGSGAKLARYEIDARERFVGADLRCSVRLWIDRGAGKTIREVVDYNVGTNPVLTVVRAGDR